MLSNHNSLKNNQHIGIILAVTFITLSTGILIGFLPTSTSLFLTVGGLILVILIIFWWYFSKTYPFDLPIISSLIAAWIGIHIWQATLPEATSLNSTAILAKNVSGILIVMLWVGLQGIKSKQVRRTKIYADRSFRAMLLFVGFVAVTMLSESARNFELLGMYFCWTIYVFILMPNLFNDKERLTFAIKVLTICGSIIVGWYVFSGLNNGVLRAWNNVDLTFEFVAVQIYGRTLAVLFLGGLFLLLQSKGKREKFWYGLLTLTLLYLLFSSNSRSNWMFFFVSLLTFGLYAERKIIKFLATVAGGFLLFILIASIFYTPTSELNRISSGRIILFQRSLNERISNNSNLELLIGSQNTLESSTLSQPETEQAFLRQQIENNYLTIFFAHGALGLILFLIPFFYIGRNLHQNLKICPKEDRLLIIFSIGTLYGLALSVLTINHIPSFGNPLAIMLPIFWVPFSFRYSITDKNDR